MHGCASTGYIFMSSTHAPTTTPMWVKRQHLSSVSIITQSRWCMILYQFGTIGTSQGALPISTTLNNSPHLCCQYLKNGTRFTDDFFIVLIILVDMFLCESASCGGFHCYRETKWNNLFKICQSVSRSLGMQRVTKRLLLCVADCVYYYWHVCLNALPQFSYGTITWIYRHNIAIKCYLFSGG